MIGIYKIENLINHKCYVGQSVNIERRWKDECRYAFNADSASYEYPLSRALRKYGVNNFSFTVLEECLKEQLNERERYWIHTYDSFYHGYNQTLGGDAKCVLTSKKEEIIKAINLLKTTDLYHREIAEQCGISIEMVQGMNTGRYWFSPYEDYPLQKQHKAHVSTFGVTKWYCEDCGCEISKGATYCRECYKKRSHKVNHPSKEELYNFLVKNRGNFSLAGRTYGVSDNAVRKWCDSYGISRSSGFYKNISS